MREKHTDYMFNTVHCVFILPQASSYENRWDGWYGDEAKYVQTGSKGGKRLARPSLIPSLCTHFTRAGIEWRR